MKKNSIIVFVLTFALTAWLLMPYRVMASGGGSHKDGLIRLKSRHSVNATINRLQSALKRKGMTIFERINHADAGRKVGITLRPTELLIFGNPKIGTKLMQCSQEAGIDLPQRALAYKDKTGQVWLIYNNPFYMARRHNIYGCKTIIDKLSKALSHFMKMAAE